MNRTFVVTAVLSSAMMLSVCQAGGDPFYYSTWYGQSSPQLAWSSQSVMFNHPNSLPYSTLSGTNFGSPRFFYPGYGYVTPSSGFRSGVPDYGVTYAFGMHQPSMTNISTFGAEPSASVYSTSQLFPRNAAGSVIPGNSAPAMVSARFARKSSAVSDELVVQAARENLISDELDSCEFNQ